ncbi:LytTR family DNA-binding domain-containing protein [Dyadobacter sp. Leaf189]|uniref:LytR/AlgR family response regulator transcription factor n=1 Tax=Dyadobacter sp. Leaf189 TaxID=1736295 RepID=UPI0006F99EB2|nr:LytTR family DNA-binding domain-containing protein [Dyadobacter sp. Leaf189]KQS23883.1 LytTR family transcriptional regulator [Dyadobacter sp. Leaf189]
MQKINCLIVDDEPIARDILKTYCAHFPYLNVAGSVGNALEIKPILYEQKVDILFLDINMPVMDGVTFLKTLKNPPQVIFTTAYREYALDAFELSACDYLLKPFSLERFVVAVDKAVERLQPGNPPAFETAAQKPDDFIFIKTDGKIFKVLFNELLYAEASGNYIKIVLTTSTLLPAMTFSNFEDMLPKATFIRIHRSFIVNKSKISHIEGNRIFLNQTELPIGTSYREGLLKELGLNS